MPEFTVTSRDGTALAGEDKGEGEGTPVVLLHGLTASRRYVVHGSRALERAGHRVIAYDARGHGASSPAPDYGYALLAGDLGAVLDDRGLDRAVLAGASMGAHTIVRFALDHPQRVAGMVLITPGHLPGVEEDGARLGVWDRLARGLREGGVDGFLAASDFSAMSEQWRETVTRVIRQRLEHHADLDAVADAVAGVSRSRPFAALEDLARLEQPTVVVGSRDAPDPAHPLRTARAYAEALPQGRLVVEDEGSSPLAWQGGQLSRVIAELAAEA